MSTALTTHRICIIGHYRVVFDKSSYDILSGKETSPVVDIPHSIRIDKDRIERRQLIPDPSSLPELFFNLYIIISVSSTPLLRRVGHFMSMMKRPFVRSTKPEQDIGNRVALMRLDIGLPGENIVAYVDKDSKAHTETLRHYQTGLDLGSEDVRKATLIFYVIAVQYAALSGLPERCLHDTDRPVILVSTIGK